MADAPFTCKNCGGPAHRLLYNHPDRLGFGHCCEERARSESSHIHTGRKIWSGREVYGDKRLKSDELRVDTEAAMLGGSGAGLKG